VRGLEAKSFKNEESETTSYSYVILICILFYKELKDLS